MAEKKQEVLIFYSSYTDPDLLKNYAEGIAYLHDSGITTKVIDVAKHPELAEKHKIMATPTLRIKKGKQVHTYLGIVEGLKRLLFHDLHGKSILHLLGFKEGRELGQHIQFTDRNQLEKDLAQMLSRRGIKKLRLVKFDQKKNYAKLSMVSDLVKELKKSKSPVCFEVVAFLGGIFTELFGRGVHFKEINCLCQGNPCCEFETVKEQPQRIEKSIMKKL